MNPQFTQPKTVTAVEGNKQSIARDFGVKASEVCYAKVDQPLTGYKVIYDKTAQRAYSLPTGLTGTVVSMVNGILTHSGGTVDLGALAVTREEFVTLQATFTAGFTINVKNEVVSDGTTLVRWGGALPKTVPAGSTPITTGGISSGAWVSVKRNANQITTVADVATGGYSINSIITLSDRDNAVFKVVAGGTQNGMDVLSAGNGNTATLLIDSATSIKAIGAKQDNIDTDETAFIQRWIQICNGPIKFGNCAFTTLDLTGSFARQITLMGDVKALPSSADVLWQLATSTSTMEYADINLNGYTVDCNFQNMTTRNDWIRTDYVNSICVYNGKIKNMYNRGIGGGLSTYRLLDVHKVQFEEGSLHNGSIDPAGALHCVFIGTFAGDRTKITFCKLKQLTDPVGTQNRNPGGIFLSGGNPAKEIIVEDNEFDNLGNLIGGNLVSPLDVYSHARQVTFTRNRFTRSRYVAFRSTNAERTIIENNEVLQNVPIAYDGGAVYNDAGCLSVGLVPRGYAINAVDNYVYEIRNNVFKVTVEAGNCRAITCASDSNENIVYMVSLVNNVYSGVNTNTAPAVMLDKILNFEISDSYVKGFDRGYAIQRTDSAGTLSAAKGFSGKSTGRISTKSLAVVGVGVYCRLECTNLSLKIENVDMLNCPLPFTVRGIASLRTEGNLLGASSSGDAQTNGAFWHLNNAVPFSTDPVGYATNTYYRLINNVGRTDRLSA